MAHGVAHSGTGETLLLANGVLHEPPLTIEKNLTIEGARGPVKSVLKPAADVEPGSAWFVVAPGASVEWKMVTFEGAGRQVPEALRFEGSGTVAESTFKKLRASGGNGIAVAVLAGGVTVYKSEFSEVGRTAVLLSGPGPESSVLGSRLNGSGAGEEYGVVVRDGAQASILNSTIGEYAGGGEGVRSAAVSLRGAPAGTEARILAGDLRRNTVGLDVDGTSGEADVAAQASAFVGNGTGISAEGASVLAADNWWGCNEGPGAPGCDSVAGSVETPTWLTLALEASPGSAPVGGTIALTARLTRNSAGQQVDVPSLEVVEELESGRPHEEGVGATGFADGTAISFAAEGGYLASPVTTAAGAATTTLTVVGPPGTASARASLDAASATAQVTVEREVREGGATAAPAPPAAAGPTSGNDRLYGTPERDSIGALAGNDLLVGRGGDDRLNGGRGRDAIYGGVGDDLLLGGLDDDVLNGGPGSDVLKGGDGADVLTGGRGRDVLLGGAGDDRLRAADGEPGDTAGCGPGFDLAVADRGDAIGRTCERTLVRSNTRSSRAGHAETNQHE
ncbi:MAG TPA: hypothetical protein VFY69_05485 [Solirubrobacterales bacterium]|nr:hypothetical protein [Solirubrobacterales bacterium]